MLQEQDSSDGGAPAQEYEEALATAEEPEADDPGQDHRAAVLAKMSQIPEAKQEIEIVSRAQ